MQEWGYAFIGGVIFMMAVWAVYESSNKEERAKKAAEAASQSFKTSIDMLHKRITNQASDAVEISTKTHKEIELIKSHLKSLDNRADNSSKAISECWQEIQRIEAKANTASDIAHMAKIDQARGSKLVIDPIQIQLIHREGTQKYFTQKGPKKKDGLYGRAETMNARPT